MQRRICGSCAAPIVRTVIELGPLDDPARHQHALPGVGRPAVRVADRGSVGAVQPASRVLADQPRPLRQPAHMPVGKHPRRVLGDLPQPGERIGLALQVAHVVKEFERSPATGRSGTRTRSRQSSPAGRGGASNRLAKRARSLGRTRSQSRSTASSMLAAEWRHARKARLGGQRHPDAPARRCGRRRLPPCGRPGRRPGSAQLSPALSRERAQALAISSGPPPQTISRGGGSPAAA